MIGDKIKQLLKLRDIKQTQLARHLEISTSRLSNYLSNKREPDLNILSKIAKYLSTDLNYFSEINFNRTKDALYTITEIDNNIAGETAPEYSADEMIKIPLKSFTNNDKLDTNYRYIHREFLKNVNNPLSNAVIFEAASTVENSGISCGDYILAAKFNSISKKSGLTVFEIKENIEYYKYVENNKSKVLISADNKNIIFIDKNILLDDFYIILWIFKKNY